MKLKLYFIFLMLMMTHVNAGTSIPKSCPLPTSIISSIKSDSMVKTNHLPGLFDFRWLNGYTDAYGEWQVNAEILETNITIIHAYELVKQALPSLYYVGGPKLIEDGLYECGYYTNVNNILFTLIYIVANNQV